MQPKVYTMLLQSVRFVFLLRRLSKATKSAKKIKIRDGTISPTWEPMWVRQSRPQNCRKPSDFETFENLRNRKTKRALCISMAYTLGFKEASTEVWRLQPSTLGALGP